MRLPAAYNGVFALKPSLGRVPIYPPFLGRVAGPMTRTVTDAALLMTPLTKPDPRDFMALPYQEIDWPGLLQGGVNGKKLGLLLDIGIGLTLQPAVRAAIEAAASRCAGSTSTGSAANRGIATSRLSFRFVMPQRRRFDSCFVAEKQPRSDYLRTFTQGGVATSARRY